VRHKYIRRDGNERAEKCLKSDVESSVHSLSAFCFCTRANFERERAAWEEKARAQKENGPQEMGGEKMRPVIIISKVFFCPTTRIRRRPNIRAAVLSRADACALNR
jgi:hypothetical protein